MTAFVRYDELPSVCRGCQFCESESKDEYSPSYHYCTRSLILPTKSNKCKIKENPANKTWWQK